jgi:hypothetical protein
MPIYEYQCKTCGHIVEELRSIADRERPVTSDCAQTFGLPGKADDFCKFEFVLSATPTTFRFNDFTGYRGMDETRGNRGPKKRKVDKVLKQW